MREPAVAGTAYGAALYLLNFKVFAPAAFPVLEMANQPFRTRLEREVDRLHTQVDRESKQRIVLHPDPRRLWSEADFGREAVLAQSGPADDGSLTPWLFHFPCTTPSTGQMGTFRAPPLPNNATNSSTNAGIA